MIYLPATAGITTHRIRTASTAAAWLAGLAGAATVAADATGIAPGAVAGMYTGSAVAAMAAVALRSSACIRRMVATTTTAVVAEQAEQRQAQAVTAETLTQLVAEIGRLRALVRDRDDLVAELARERVDAQRRADEAYEAGRAAGARQAMEVVEQVDRAEAAGGVRRLPRTS